MSGQEVWFYPALAVSELLAWVLLAAYAWLKFVAHRTRAAVGALVLFALNETVGAPLALWHIGAGHTVTIIHVDAMLNPIVLLGVALVAGPARLRRLDMRAERAVGLVQARRRDDKVGLYRAACRTLATQIRLGNSDRADRAALRRAASSTGQLVPDRTHAREERRGWLLHAACYGAFVMVLAAAARLGWWGPVDIPGVGSDGGDDLGRVRRWDGRLRRRHALVVVLHRVAQAAPPPAERGQPFGREQLST